MTEGYVPSEFCDEVTPAPREHPNAWIIEREGRFFLDQSDDHSADEETPIYEIKHGKSYGFHRLEDFGEATLTVRADGSYSVDREMPATAEQVYVVSDSDTLSSSIAEMVADALDEGEYDIAYFTWHEEIWTFDTESRSFSRGSA